MPIKRPFIKKKRKKERKKRWIDGEREGRKSRKFGERTMQV